MNLGGNGAYSHLSFTETVTSYIGSLIAIKTVFRFNSSSAFLAGFRREPSGGSSKFSAEVRFFESDLRFVVYVMFELGGSKNGVCCCCAF